MNCNPSCPCSLVQHRLTRYRAITDKMEISRFIARGHTAMFLIVLQIGLYAIASTACPNTCKCTDGLVDCSYRGLESIPTDIAPNTTTLNLSGNNFSSIPKSAFNLTDLQILILGNCSIKELAPLAFKRLVNLHALDLQNNRIEELRSSTFFGVAFKRVSRCWGGSTTHTCGLDLRNNPLKSIHAGAFNTAKGPRIYIGDQTDTMLTIESTAFAYLEQADIVITDVANLVIKPFAFQQCDQPGSIKIQNSAMTSLPRFAFSGIRRITLLDIDNCTIGDIDQLFHYTTFIGRDNYWRENAVYIRRSTINSTLPYMTFFGSDARSISFTENTIRGLGNFVFGGQKLYNLIIAGNVFTDQDSLTSYSLGNIVEAEEGIFLSNNSFSSIDKDAFYGTKTAKKLKISGHNSNFTISPLAFRGLTIITEELEFDKMDALVLEKDSFADININRIRFYESTILKFDVDAFDTCKPGFKSLNMLSGPIPCDCFAAGLAYFCRFKDIGYFVSCRDGQKTHSVSAFGKTAEWHAPSATLPKCTAQSALTCSAATGGKSLFFVIMVAALSILHIKL